MTSWGSFPSHAPQPALPHALAALRTAAPWAIIPLAAVMIGACFA